MQAAFAAPCARCIEVSLGNSLSDDFDDFGRGCLFGSVRYVMLAPVPAFAGDV